ncbi:MAG: hypothetical protein A2418_00020 [Candidatus Brennerbacteria bacterium RIFOXYC1_FULL_41_11]|uniref:Uncharacterized protein n=1 Tax=Candidatus Brennerbacteria bacterium RIFOXYD1_FULL_41_16 TaxID=1797529 RepID=A0A1G1XLT4_9BACT|nr:MAG: hypothetical protein A2391_00370 [Candidatus Brennerbacteria bacterium RIFOXYB1_FULL_41_13]OGY40602.1 MAG: hypothetical protein A2418_00020 [Candidatus Brennerbacteria bacterium RIFOXYC1_FULL_41_11]OGY40999.1 MAG: hypothetical protein A2570_01700 [Candidatus Brennerbacteria bacterium RIFOXYD1_FULL_41_16]
MKSLFRIFSITVVLTVIAVTFGVFAKPVSGQTPAAGTAAAEAGDVLQGGKPATKTPKSGGGGHTPVTICHQTGNGGYIEITVDDDGAYNGHINHEGDIIPAPAGGCPKGNPSTATNQPSTQTPRPTSTAVWTLTSKPPKPTAAWTPTPNQSTRTPRPTATNQSPTQTPNPPSPTAAWTLTSKPPKELTAVSAQEQTCATNAVATEHYGFGTDREWNIWLFDKAGNFIRDLTSGVYQDVRNPSWSADGCWIAVQLEISEGFYAIAIIGYDGGVESILNVGYSAIEPEVVSEDLIVFVREDNAQLMFWDLTMGAAAAATGEFQDAVGNMPHYNLTGGFAYTSSNGMLVVNNGNGKASDTGVRCFAPEWYPDGSAVLCHGLQRNGIWGVYKVSNPWTSPTVILFLPYAYGGTAFNPTDVEEYAQIKFGVFYGERVINDALWFGPGSDWLAAE